MGLYHNWLMARPHKPFYLRSIRSGPTTNLFKINLDFFGSRWYSKILLIKHKGFILKIQNFDNYYYLGGKIYSKKTDKESKPHIVKGNKVRVKLKNNDGKWLSISLEKVKALAGDVMVFPDNAVRAMYCDYTHVTPCGRFFTLSPMYPRGKELSPSKNSKGYLNLKLKYRGKRSTVDCHKIMCETFIDKDYTSKGLVCLHLDDDKANCKLDNLKVGTYSENNKSAYENGLNKGNVKKLGNLNNKVIWPKNYLLKQMYETMTLVDIAKKLNCSGSAVKKRLRKIGFIG